MRIIILVRENKRKKVQEIFSDVDALEEEVQRLNVRWENVNQQVAERLISAEKSLQIQMVYR